MINFIKPTDKLSIGGLMIFLYGEPGIGKTSVANTAGNCFLFDADNTGANRAINRQYITRLLDTELQKSILPQGEFGLTIDEFIIYLTSGSLIKDLEAGTGERLDSLIIDNTDNFMNMILGYCARRNPSLILKTGQYDNMRVYGEAKPVLKNIIKFLRLTGRNIINITHEKADGGKENKRTGDKKATPNAASSVLTEMGAACDLIGRITAERGGRWIDFSPSAEGFGKNPANLPAMQIPDFDGPSNWFLDKIINPTREAMSAPSISNEAVRKDIERFKAKIHNAQNASDVNGIIAELIELKDSNAKAYSTVRPELKKRATELSLVFNSTVGNYEDVQTAN